MVFFVSISIGISTFKFGYNIRNAEKVVFVIERFNNRHEVSNTIFNKPEPEIDNLLKLI